MNFDKKNLHLANCIFNSSLYWWFWIKISDCWHITNKELTNFKIPSFISDDDYKELEKLSQSLNKKLEKTKNKINTKQAMFEYKHRFCKDIIDLIDEKLGKLYKFSKKEIQYLQNYQIYYRVAGELNETKK